jgi:hypothetical protein
MRTATNSANRLATLMRPLIDQDLSVVFYDLTTVAVTGQSDLEDDVRAYGMAKVRPDRAPVHVVPGANR